MRQIVLLGFIVSAAWSLAAVPAFADDAAAGVRRIGVGGFWIANMATVSYSPAPVDITSHEWNGGGATVDIALGRHASIDARAMWNRKGAKLTLAANTAFQDVRADYLSIPVLFKAGTSGPVRAYVTGGPEVSVRLAARVISTFGNLTLDEDARDVTRRTDLAADFGGGVERDLGPARLFVEALYSYGLKNVVVPTTPGEAARTRTLTLAAGLRF
jgi:outer membrane protein with beta-barrel domain